MKIQSLFLITLFSCFVWACVGDKSANLGEVEVREVTLVDIVDEEPMPPPNFKSPFKTLDAWLSSICEGDKPRKAISIYQFDVFESGDDNVVALFGINEYRNKDTTFIRIEFEPPNMYFQIPATIYKNLKREELLNKLMLDLSNFTSTEKFKNSYLAQAEVIKFKYNGKIIWSRN